MKGSDFVAEFLVQQGVEHVFGLTGGACAHLVDSFGRHKKLDMICTQHEQAAAMAADGYARIHSSQLGVTVATSGPGATNLITGIASSWFDSISTLHITGQVNTFESKGNLGIRQMGFQETDIVSMVKGITKFAVKVEKPEQLKAALEEAVYWAKTDRPGPVLVDIPFNVQRTDIDPDKLEGFTPPASGDDSLAKIDFALLLDKLKNAKRPVFLLGGGIKNSSAVGEANSLVNLLNIPVVATWSGIDVLSNDHQLYRGNIGVYGGRAANFTVQNADFLLAVGTRLDSRITGGKYASFAREAFKVIVDIDESEFHKGRVVADMSVCADARHFMQSMLFKIKDLKLDNSEWVDLTRKWRDELPVYDTSIKKVGIVNPYHLVDKLSQFADVDACVFADTGANLAWLMQAFQPSKRQRLISAFGNSPMGYSLPAAIGAMFASNGRQVICVAGDGGIQLNIQEFQTAVGYNLPLKLIIFNNHGYGMIKQFQDLYLEGRHIATGEGYTAPDFKKVVKAYGLSYLKLENDGDVDSCIREFLACKDGIVLDVSIFDRETIVPKLGWGKPIEDQLPMLPREEFEKYMLIKPLPEEES